MIAIDAELLDLSRTGLLTAVAVFLRIGAMMALLPAFGEQMIPVRVRLATALAFTAIVTPAVAPQLGQIEQIRLIYFGTEALTGLFWGILLRLLVMTLSIAGSIAAQSTSLSQILGGASVEPLPAMGHLMVMAGLTLAVILGLHVHLAAMMIETYTITPFAQRLDADLVSTIGLSHVRRAFALAFSLAGPFVIASVLYNVALGVINRAMPQLMVSFVGAPALTAGGLFLLFLTLPYILTVWSGALNAFLVQPASAPR
ncbi:flagellar biosynthetic protein FliR [Aestuariibius insulae]|uniref:flagellar biosynthetic protein FliR n=1 Tax=Aestuariibius insulae TaxID=2058287 RepID=UPI00345E8925